MKFDFWRRKEKKSYRTTEIDRSYSNSATWNDWDVDKAIDEGYKSSVPVYSCVKKRMDSVASIPLVVEVKRGDEWEAQPNHPLQILLDAPNPDMTTDELVKMMIGHLDLAGNAYWMKVRGGKNGLPLELWPAMPQGIIINTGVDRFINSYRVGSSGKTVPFEDMCHFKYINPNSFYFGQSPLQAAGKAVDVDNAGQTWQKISMQNRGVPDFHVSFDNELTPEQHEQAVEVIKRKTGPGSAREPLVTSKATINQLSQTPIEMDFMNTRRFSREEVCSVYGVPSALIAEMGAVNLANSETARRLFWLDTIIPLMDEVVGALNSNLSYEYGKDVRIAYDISNVPALQENYSEKLDNAKKLWSLGVPLNAINQRLELGLDNVVGGDIGYIPTGVIPSSFDAVPTVDEEVKKEIFDKIVKSHSAN